MFGYGQQLNPCCSPLVALFIRRQKVVGPRTTWYEVKKTMDLCGAYILRNITELVGLSNHIPFDDFKINPPPLQTTSIQSPTTFLNSSSQTITMFKRPQPFEEDRTRPKRRATFVAPSSPHIQPEGNDPTDRVKGFAFRISNIPSHITGDEFFRVLDRLPRETSSNDDGGSNVLGKSFVPAAASADSERYNTATVTFVSVPVIFKFTGTSCSIRLIDSHIIVDKHFFGLTPLGVSGQQTTVEYAFLHSSLQQTANVNPVFLLSQGLPGMGSAHGRREVPVECGSEISFQIMFQLLEL